MDKALVRLVRERANHSCEYCQLPQSLSSIPFEIDHVISQKHHGPSVSDNLALSCYYCNSFKGPNIAGMDSVTQVITRLFHPRQDQWSIHFRWHGAVLEGLTAIGRTTIDVLGINSPDTRALRESLRAEGIAPWNS